MIGGWGLTKGLSGGAQASAHNTVPVLGGVESNARHGMGWGVGRAPHGPAHALMGGHGRTVVADQTYL